MYDCVCEDALVTESQPNNVGSCLSFLCQELRVMHHLLQETNYPHLQFRILLKVLRTHTGADEASSLRCRLLQRHMDKREERKVNFTCECLETQ